MKKTLLLTVFLFLGILTTANSQVCGGTFTDPAGATANYEINSDYTVTINPVNPGDVVTVTFTSFDVEAEWDALYVFNGTSTASTQIASANPAANVPGGLAGGFWGTSNPGPFTSTDASGSLTFRFRSDDQVVGAGWIANVTCGPPVCAFPTNPTVTTITATTAVLGWTENGGATSWEIFAVPCGSPLPTATSVGQTVTTNPTIVTGLTAGTCYNFFVRAACLPSGYSTFCISSPFTTAAGPPGCGGQFTDNGGINSDYTVNADDTTVICPTNPGDLVTVTFTSFTTEVNFDALYVFNGNSIGAPQIASTNGTANVPGGLAGGYWGTTIPGPFTSSDASGCLTFRFRSDPSITRAGWTATITCGPPPTCRAPSALTVSAITTTSLVLNWAQPANPDTSVANAWECLVLPSGSPLPTASTTGFVSASAISYAFIGLLPNTCYTFYVRAVCSATEKSDWSNGITACTNIAPPACGGTFVDNGGVSANYANNSDNTYTVCPTNPGEIVSVVFTAFDTEATWDALYVFDGNSIASPQITSSNPSGNVPGGLAGGYWGTTIPGPFTSTSPDGCLTFRFRSDNTANRAGWTANVVCAPDSDKIVLVAYVDQNSNGVKDTGEPLFSNGSFVYQQNNDGTNVNAYSPTGQYAIYDADPSNIYNFSYQLHSEFAPYYDSGTTTYSNISVTPGSGTQFLYFPVTLTQSYTDVAVSITPVSNPRPGFTYANKITYKNQGLLVASGTITFTKPTQVTTYTVTPAATNTATGFTYAFTNLQPNETRIMYVTLTVPDGTTVNTLLTDNVSISAVSGDINAANNSNSNTQIVVNSLDPNTKMESRGKTIPFNQFTQDDYFFYTIRFQNDGTANAIDLRIEDLLNAKIDETTVRMVNSSHNYTMKRINNQLIWNFKNIFLQPSSVNPGGSNGYVQFKVKLRPGFQTGDIIPNNASIYFDSNPAVVTNTFNSKFTTPLSIVDFNSNSLVLYPNPARNTVQIDLVNTNEQLSKVVFYDMLGKTVKTVSTFAANSVAVTISDLPKGIYLVEITSENNLKLTRKLIIQ